MPESSGSVKGGRSNGLSLAKRQGYKSSISTAATTAATETAFGLTIGPLTESISQSKGKDRATSANFGIMASPIDDERPGGAGRSFSKDLERGPDVLGYYRSHEAGHKSRDSTTSLPDDGMGIGSAISSSNSSIMGDPDAPQNVGEEWGPQHPCFPHRNSHVSVDDPEYISTRIIRIRRDWLIMGDLAPTFSNLYPEILDPAGMNEPEFRRVIDKLNGELTAAFAPWSARNIADGFLGLVSGWLWEDLGLTGAKARLARLERWIEAWNREMARTADEGAPIPPKIIPLRQTGYMTVCSGLWPCACCKCLLTIFSSTFRLATPRLPQSRPVHQLSLGRKCLSRRLLPGEPDERRSSSSARLHSIFA